MPVWCCACYFVGFDLSVNNLSVHFVVSYANHSTYWWVLFTIKWAENLDKSDLTELKEIYDRATYNGLVKRLWQEFLIRYGTHFR